MAISSAVDPSAVARVVGIKTQFKNLQGGATLLPQRIAVIGQGSSAASYPLTKQQVFSGGEAGDLYGYGSPVHLAVVQLLPANGDGVGAIPVTVYPMEDGGGAVASITNVAPTGTATAAGTFTIKVNNINSVAVPVVVGDTVAILVAAMTAAVNGVLGMPVIGADNASTSVDLTAKWAGDSSNGVQVEVVGPTDIGFTFSITTPTAGATNPDVDTPLLLMGNVWETMVVNCLDINDSASLNKYETFGEGRWGALVRKPLVVFTSNTTTSVTGTPTTIPDARASDRINSQLVSPGSNDLPFVNTARQVSRIAIVANNNIPHDYGSQRALGLTPGVDADQWNYAERDTAVKAGSSTIEVKDGVVTLSDIVTMYHPAGEVPPAYRYVVDIVKLQNIIFNLDLIFANTEWDGAPLLPDDQPTSNRSAKKPKTAKMAVASLMDSLGLEAIISDPAAAKASILAEIDGSNPKRLNIAVTVQLSGNANIISVDLDFGFYFGTPTVVA